MANLLLISHEMEGATHEVYQLSDDHPLITTDAEELECDEESQQDLLDAIDGIEKYMAPYSMPIQVDKILVYYLY
jgi:hypothetical protein